MKQLIQSFFGLMTLTLALTAHTVYYTYDDTGSMIQRTVITLSPFIADTTKNKHLYVVSVMRSTAPITVRSKA